MGVIQQGVNQLFTQGAILSALGAQAGKETAFYKGHQALREAKASTRQSENLRQIAEQAQSIGTPLEEAEKRLYVNQQAERAGETAQEKAGEAVGYLGSTKGTSTQYSAASQTRGKAHINTGIQQNIYNKEKEAAQLRATEISPEEIMAALKQKAIPKVQQRDNYALFLEELKNSNKGGK